MIIVRLIIGGKAERPLTNFRDKASMDYLHR